MIEKLIGQYVNKLTLTEIKEFAKSNGIIINNDVAKIIYKYIKSDWHTIVYGNARPILDEIKKQIDLDTYLKIENLYVDFKQKYQSYL